MSNAVALSDLVDEYVRADAAEKAAKARKDEIKKALLESGMDVFKGTHAKLSITNSERVTLDAGAVKAVLTPSQFLSVVSVSCDKARKMMDPTVFKACIDNVTYVSTVRISALATA